MLFVSTERVTGSGSVLLPLKKDLAASSVEMILSFLRGAIIAGAYAVDASWFYRCQLWNKVWFFSFATATVWSLCVHPALLIWPKSLTILWACTRKRLNAPWSACASAVGTSSKEPGATGPFLYICFLAVSLFFSISRKVFTVSCGGSGLHFTLTSQNPPSISTLILWLLEEDQEAWPVRRKLPSKIHSIFFRRVVNFILFGRSGSARALLCVTLSNRPRPGLNGVKDCDTFVF